MKKSWLIRALLLTAYCVPFAFFSVKGDITSGTMLYYRRDDRQLCDIVPLRAENRQRSDHFYRKYTELYFFLFDDKAVEVRPDGMVLQAVYIPLSDCRDIGRVPHHPCNHRMEKRQKAEERTGV